MMVCGKSDNYYDATRFMKSKFPDMITAGITLKDVNGFELIKYLNDGNIKIPVLVLSMHDETIYAKRAMKAGACDYIMKHESYES